MGSLCWDIVAKYSKGFYKQHGLSALFVREMVESSGSFPANSQRSKATSLDWSGPGGGRAAARTEGVGA